MTNNGPIDTGKLPGKTQYSGRRRTTTRKSGFTSHADSTGGELKVEKVDSYLLAPGEAIKINFLIEDVHEDELVAYGGWYIAPIGLDVDIRGGYTRRTFTSPDAPNWSKLGSMWPADSDDDIKITVTFTAKEKCEIALYGLACGVVKHKHLDWAKENKPVLLNNMYEFSPEANFITTPGTVDFDLPTAKGSSKNIYLKSCNRCARFLPINVVNERHHLSYSNHCVASHRLPCSHGGFGKLKNINTSETLELVHGYQLECRFCKKYEVNAAHNPQRTAAQMKEDGARRRAFELLLMELYEGSYQLQFRHDNGKELANYVWNKFKGHCFNCESEIENINLMHLDHTRPLALLWPLDGTATCLCGSCNSQKRDRPPVEFYSEEKLEELSGMTGISIDELKDPVPNLEAINLLSERLDWFFKEFLLKPELNKVRDGKLTAELLVKALQKAIEKSPGNAPFNIYKMYRERYH